MVICLVKYTMGKDLLLPNLQFLSPEYTSHAPAGRMLELNCTSSISEVTAAEVDRFDHIASSILKAVNMEDIEDTGCSWGI